MALCERNKRLVHYKLYTGRTEVVDSNGRRTGAINVTYGNMASIKAVLSANKGSASVEMFGTELAYTRTMTTDDMKCPLDENSIVWVDAPTSGKHDYVVVSVARGLSNISYALRKVDVS